MEARSQVHAQASLRSRATIQWLQFVNACLIAEASPQICCGEAMTPEEEGDLLAFTPVNLKDRFDWDYNIVPNDAFQAV